GGGIQDVLAGGAEVDEGSRGGRYGRGQVGDQRDDGAARRHRPAAQVGGVEPVGQAAVGDRGGVLGGYPAGAGERGGQGPLHVEHGPQPRRVADLPVDLRRAEQRPEQPTGWVRGGR